MPKINIPITFNLSTLILTGIIIVLLFFGGWRLYQTKVNNLREDLTIETNLKYALLDSIKYFQNKEKEWVAEKSTIQETIKNLENINGLLTESQKELIIRIKEIEKINDIIAAALIETHVKLDSLLHKGTTVVDIPNTTIKFKDYHKDGNKEFGYGFTVGNVIPSPLTAKPTLLIDSIYFPNKQFVEFHWKNDRSRGRPVTFSVSNSNYYFKTVNLDSYAIPALRKEILDPNIWQKIEMFFVKNNAILIGVGVGVVVGGVGFLYLSK